MEILACHPFRVTRDADFELTDAAEDLLVAMESVLRQRTKFGAAVRLEVDPRMTPDVLDLLCRELELSAQDVYVVDGPLDLSGLWDLYSLRHPELKYEIFSPQTPPPLAGDEPDVLWAMRAGTYCCIIPMTRSARRSRRSSIKRPVTGTCSRSNRRCIAPAVTKRASCSPSSRRPRRESRSSRSWSSRRASTSRRTSSGRECWWWWCSVSRFPFSPAAGSRETSPSPNAGLEQARLRLQQTRERAQVDARNADLQLAAAVAAWEASAGTEEQAGRAYQIAEVRYREGLSTQTELNDLRIQLAQAQATAGAGRT